MEMAKYFLSFIKKTLESPGNINVKLNIVNLNMTCWSLFGPDKAFQMYWPPIGNHIWLFNCDVKFDLALTVQGQIEHDYNIHFGAKYAF